MGAWGFGCERESRVLGLLGLREHILLENTFYLGLLGLDQEKEEEEEEEEEEECFPCHPLRMLRAWM
jgi:hypothetical protein